ncbi:MAG TPA: carboxypeptidase regulatory-like domain-containing protein [Longimicrobium sp.]|nr:carboxypeptidase regulatory-like domain-containing protein [Longimicrobium sp.]
MNRIRWTATTCAAAFAAACLASTSAAAQRAIVRGQVIDTQSGQPVPNAAVYVDDNRTAVLADAQGRFEVKHVRPGTRGIWARVPGYTMDLSLVEVPADSVRVTLRMQGDPVRLATLQVTTSRLDRRARGYAGTVRVFREADLAGMWYSNVGQLVQSRARVYATPCRRIYSLSRSYASSSCVSTRGTVAASHVIVDEAPWLGGVGDLRDFHLADVARVEVYGHGREIRVYTRQFMDWISKRPYVPTPLGFGV